MRNEVNDSAAAVVLRFPFRIVMRNETRIVIEHVVPRLPGHAQWQQGACRRQVQRAETHRAGDADAATATLKGARKRRCSSISARHRTREAGTTEPG